jgi:uracil-DNA glycosylase family 4
MSRLVGSSGPPHAAIAIVGEAPGVDEERLGEPFVGQSGKLLTKMLQAAGIERRDCYITNVAKERPPGNDFARRYYQDSRRNVPGPELPKLWEGLVAELRAVKPNVILALGEEALRALTGKRKITDWRGSILASSAGKVVATYHPAGIMRMYEHRRIAERDIRRVRDESSSPELCLPEHEFILDPSFEQAMAVLDRLARDAAPVAFDIETLGERVRCVGFAWSAADAICVPFTSARRRGSLFAADGKTIPLPSETPFASHWTREEEEELVEAMERVLSGPTPLIAQNFPFDASFLEREWGIVCNELLMDTMVAQHCCYSELPKGLDFLCSFYTRVPYYSDYDPSSDLDTWRYNCYDCAVTFEVATVLAREMKEMKVG